MQDADKLQRELAAIVRSDIATDFYGRSFVTIDEVKASAARSFASLMAPPNVHIEVSDDLGRIIITYGNLMP